MLVYLYVNYKNKLCLNQHDLTMGALPEGKQKKCIL